LDELKTLYEDKTNDFLLLDNKIDCEKLCAILDENNFSEMKCYSMTDCIESELIQYFKLLYKSCDDYVILYHKPEGNQLASQIKLSEKSSIINLNDVGTNNWNVSYIK
jgi:hypothetical protein